MNRTGKHMDNFKILVLENDERCCGIISGNNRMNNFIFCSDATDFKEKLDESFSAVMIDSMLHTKDNGIQLLRDLKDDHRFSRLPIILITDDSPFFSTDVYKKFGADFILFKPLSEQKIMRTLKSILLLKAA